ncbi:MAG: helix-turn-helix domain-containing protein [Sphingomonadaceae bacterium]|nr:helix-turn-helix domain-containing protein [Sphingomonadaceae bacterium]
MPTKASPRISTRKNPKQARSAALVEAVLQAAAQVLANEGAARFTMARVAEAAGASVGSLYQYSPNKAALLFRLQSDEWRETTELLRAILEDSAKPPI